ncbi:phosphotransferase [Streptomyces sp. V4I8]|uniref:phosphotransferase n=1 Tax=Streptomyces sp. V4I8 TaxID=3156469 RepID=UPI00351276E6
MDVDLGPVGLPLALRAPSPEAELRLRREHALLTRLQGRLPVPPVQETTVATLTLGYVAGTPGQELLDAGQPEAVLASCGELLRRIHKIFPGLRRGSTALAGPQGRHADPVRRAAAALRPRGAPPQRTGMSSRLSGPRRRGPGL